MLIQYHSLPLCTSVSVRWESCRLALWSGAPGQDVSQRDPVQRVLDWTQLWHHQLRQHPVCSAYCVPVHHHGGLGGHPLQRESICTTDFRMSLYVVQAWFLAVCLFFLTCSSSTSSILLSLLSYFSLPGGRDLRFPLNTLVQSIITITGQIGVVIYGPQKMIRYDYGATVRSNISLDQQLVLWQCAWGRLRTGFYWLDIYYIIFILCFSEDEPHSIKWSDNPYIPQRMNPFIIRHLINCLSLPSLKCQGIYSCKKQIAVCMFVFCILN